MIFFSLFSYALSFHFQGMIKMCFIMNSNIHDNEFLLLQFIEFIIRWCSSIIIYYSFLYCIEIYDLRSFIHSNQTYCCYLFSIYDFNRIFSWTQCSMLMSIIYNKNWFFHHHFASLSEILIALYIESVKWKFVSIVSRMLHINFCERNSFLHL